MNGMDLYTILGPMTSSWRAGGRACFAALIGAFLYHERYHSANAVDLLVRVRGYGYRMAYRKIEKFRVRVAVEPKPTLSDKLFTEGTLCTE